MEQLADQRQMQCFLRSASHGKIMLSLFRETFPQILDGGILHLDEPEMGLSLSNQSRVLKMLLELVDHKKFRVVCATHSPVLTGAKETFVTNLDNHTDKNVLPENQGREGQSTIQ